MSDGAPWVRVSILSVLGAISLGAFAREIVFFCETRSRDLRIVSARSIPTCATSLPNGTEGGFVAFEEVVPSGGTHFLRDALKPSEIEALRPDELARLAVAARYAAYIPFLLLFAFASGSTTSSCFARSLVCDCGGPDYSCDAVRRAIVSPHGTALLAVLSAALYAWIVNLSTFGADGGDLPRPVCSDGGWVVDETWNS
jgi:hypothetical protein